MTTIAVVPNPAGGAGYRAVANGSEAEGRTVGQAIDALAEQTGGPRNTTLIIVQSTDPDEFFTAEQQVRLADLMARWRRARQTSTPFPTEEKAELDALIADELRASAARTAAALAAMKQP
jgi:hypothetical protein